MFQLHPQLAADTVTLGSLQLCRVLLMNDSQYPWVILVPQHDAIREIYQLSASDQRTCWEESSMLSELMMSHFQGDKLNVAALGNLVPQLHIHHIVRHTSDPAWPQPVWGAAPAQPYSVEALAKLQQNLTA